MTELQIVKSVHEQRQVRNNKIPEKGHWLELGKFTGIVETFDTKKRYLCTDVKRNKGNLVVELKQLDIEKDTTIKKKLVEKIIKKHGDKLKASFMIILIQAMYDTRDDIEKQMRLARATEGIVRSGWDDLLIKLKGMQKGVKRTKLSEYMILKTDIGLRALSDAEKVKKELDKKYGGPIKVVDINNLLTKLKRIRRVYTV